MKTLSDFDAFQLIDAIKSGDEPAHEWLVKLAVWADHKAERADWYERELAAALELKKEAA